MSYPCQKNSVGFVLVLSLVLAACTSHSEEEYSLKLAKYRLQKFAFYLDDLNRANIGGFPGCVRYDGAYPPNVAEIRDGATHFLIAPPFRASPFVIREDEPLSGGASGSASRTQNESIGETFMRDAFLRPRQRDGMMIQYVSNGAWFVLASCGPDLKYESVGLIELDRTKGGIESKDLQRRVSSMMYDPTNGQLSRGDVLVLSTEVLQ